MSTTRAVRLLTVFLLVTGGAVAGCGDGDGGRTGGRPDAEVRAREVADAWDGSRAAEVWRDGFYPVDEVVQLPGDAFRNGKDKRAYTSQNFVLEGELPPPRQKEGLVRWRDGKVLTVPVMGAREAYGTVARGGNDGPALVVTGARLGTTTLATSRGRATVPAWLFTLKGYDSPLKRVAVRPSEVPGSPIGPAGEAYGGELKPLEQLIAVRADGRAVQVLAGHGGCDDGPRVDVLETGGSVVLSASVAGADDDAVCTGQLLLGKIWVELDRSLAGRVVLDAFTGRPVPSAHPERSAG